MRRFLSVCAVASILLSGAESAANVPAYIGQHVSTAQDTKAINKIIDDFQTAIKNKDRKLLSTLVLNSSILFDSPLSPEDIAWVNDKHDVTYTGIRAGG